MSKPAFTIVIPCFNDGAYLGEAVGSVRDLPKDQAEIIIVDDGSTDAATLQLIAGFEAQGIRVHRQPNGGLARARNAGISIAQGEFIIPLDSDNRLRATMLDRAQRIFSERPDVGVVYGDSEFFGEKTGRHRVGNFEQYRLMHWNYIDACAAYRKKVWEEVGGYDAAMPVQGLEDWDFWLGVAERDWKFVYVPEILFDYRVRKGSMISRARPHLEQLELYAAAKHPRLYREAFVKLLVERNSVRSQLGLMYRAVRRRLLREPTILS